MSSITQHSQAAEAASDSGWRASLHMQAGGAGELRRAASNGALLLSHKMCTAAPQQEPPAGMAAHDQPWHGLMPPSDMW